MSRVYFGTDGVRGAYGGDRVNEGFFTRLGAAAGRWKGDGGRALIGWDTRRSGESLARALAQGIRSAGMEAELLGVLPTPALARAVRSRGASLGAMVTASHNPASDNGVKFFKACGCKLSDGEEESVEKQMGVPTGAQDGVAPEPSQGSDAVREYITAATALLKPGSLVGWKVVLDAANGATCATSPKVFRGLGADVVELGCAPDGRNINAGVGSEFPGLMSERVRASGARLGVAHDGDGDRCVLADETGEVLDGDEVLAVLATYGLSQGALKGRTLVATVQSNLGLDAAVAAAGGRVLRAPVGDRYVAERMRAEGATLGGESSGHIIFSELSFSGDGLVAALKVIGVMQATGKPLSELRRVLRKLPQATGSLAVRERKPLEAMPALAAAIRSLESELGNRGRVMVRYSGTEAKIRLLVEGPTEDSVRAGLARLKEAVLAET